MGYMSLLGLLYFSGSSHLQAQYSRLWTLAIIAFSTQCYLYTSSTTRPHGESKPPSYLKHRGNCIDSSIPWANLKELNRIPMTCSGVQTSRRLRNTSEDTEDTKAAILSTFAKARPGVIITYDTVIHKCQIATAGAKMPVAIPVF